MRFLFEMGAVVLGLPTTFQTPLSGQIPPVLAVVPIGARVELRNISVSFRVWAVNLDNHCHITVSNDLTYVKDHAMISSDCSNGASIGAGAPS